MLLVDDQELIRAGLRGLLRARFGFTIVGELSDGAGVVQSVSQPGPLCKCRRAPGGRRQLSRRSNRIVAVRSCAAIASEAEMVCTASASRCVASRLVRW
ncbi:MAG: hypothetical protein QOK15_138 [Nocardioidaceae bacterium]|nr:hypothetical protein [Nocardioidaceae bacterium]